MAFAFDVVDTVREEEPDLFDDELAAQVTADADRRRGGRGGSSPRTCSAAGSPACPRPTCATYLEYVADRRLARLGLEPIYGSENPFAFMELQDVQELSNFFERRVSAYQVGVAGSVGFDDDF